MKNKNIIIFSSMLLLLTSCNENKLENYNIKDIYKINDEIKYFEISENAKGFLSLEDNYNYKEFNNFSIKETNDLINELFTSASFYEIPPHEGYNRKWFGFIEDNNCMIFDFENYTVSSEFFDNYYFFGITTCVDGKKYSSSYGVFNDEDLYNKIVKYHNNASQNLKGNTYYLGDINSPFYSIFQTKKSFIYQLSL